MADIQKLTVNNTEYTLKDAEARNSLANKAPLASPAFTGTPTAPTAEAGTNTTQIATTEFVMNAFSANDAMVFKGTIGNSVEDTVSALPDRHNKGWTYRVNTAGTYAGHACEIGDLIICITNGTSANDAHWAVAQGNIDGAVTGPVSSTSGHLVSFNGATGKIVQDSGYSASDFVAVDQGVGNFGKALVINDQGQVVPGDAAPTGGYEIFEYDLDTVTNVSGSYSHATTASTATSAMRAIHVEVGNTAAFKDRITITFGSGTITLSCPSVEGTSTVHVVAVCGAVFLTSADAVALTSTINAKADPATTVNITALSSGWRNAIPPTQTISVTGMTTTTNFLIGAGSLTSAQLEEMTAGQIRCTAQGTGDITLTCYGEVPTNDLPLVVMIID